MEILKATAYIDNLEANCNGADATKVHVTASYGWKSNVGSIGFWVSIRDAKCLYIGQGLLITITVPEKHITEADPK